MTSVSKLSDMYEVLSQSAISGLMMLCEGKMTPAERSGCFVTGSACPAAMAEVLRDRGLVKVWSRKPKGRGHQLVISPTSLGKELMSYHDSL